MKIEIENELPDEDQIHARQVEILERQIINAETVIKLLVVAGHVTQHQVDAARSLLHETKD